MPYKDPVMGRQKERERHRRRAANRRAQGLCVKCGKHPPAPERSLCEACGERGRAAERARYARGKAAGDPYGGRNPGSRRRMARERNKKRRRERVEIGLCTTCGERKPVEGGAVCETCREERRAAERKLYAERRAGGDAADAGRKSSATPRRAPRAPQGMQNAVRERTPRAGRDIATGAPGGRVLTAAPRRTQG